MPSSMSTDHFHASVRSTEYSIRLSCRLLLYLLPLT